MCDATTKFVFISESKHVQVSTDSVFSDGELWRVIGIPSNVPVGMRFKVILEQVQNTTPFDTPVIDDEGIELKELKQKLEKIKSLIDVIGL